jgi:MFS family permease
MSLLMTATPISMHAHAGHSLEATKFVIQSHIAAMYLPSLLYAALFARIGFKGMLWSGTAVYLVCLGIAAVSTEFLNYWLALVLLGIGWNFLFLSGTNLLPRGYRPEERFRVQSTNDFVVFSMQALASLGSGWILYHWHWRGIIYACIPLVILFAVLLSRTRSLEK